MSDLECPQVYSVLTAFMRMPYAREDLADLFEMIDCLDTKEKQALYAWLSCHAPNSFKWLIVSRSNLRRAAE